MTDYTGRTARIKGGLEDEVIIYDVPYGEERGRFTTLDAADLLAWLRKTGHVAVPLDFAEWAHGMMERRLQPWAGKFSVAFDFEERNRQWLTALAAALERRQGHD